MLSALKIYNMEIIIYAKVDKAIEELLESLLHRYQTDLEPSMRGNDFIFDFVNLLHYKCDKINLKRCG